MIISSIEVIPIRLPLREPFVIAYASYPDTLSVLVRIRTCDGAEGWGEATPDPERHGRDVGRNGGDLASRSGHRPHWPRCPQPRGRR